MKEHYMMLQRPSIQALFDGYHYYPMGRGQEIQIPPGFAKDNPDIMKSLKTEHRKKMSMSVMVPEPAQRKPEPAQRKPEQNKNDMSLVDKSFNGGLPYQDNSRRMYQSFNP